MQKMEEKINNFILYYKSLDKEKKKELREAFLKKTLLSYPSWYVKLARGKFSILELDLLGRICGDVF